MEIAHNKKVLFDYEILEKLEAGLVLTGAEVKSAKLGRVSLKGAYISNLGSHLYLTGATISAYQPANQSSDYDATRPRLLLLNKKEINYLIGKMKERGLTIVPLRMYTKNNLVKLEVGLARGRKKFDKRQQIKQRDDERRIRRSLKGEE